MNERQETVSVNRIRDELGDIKRGIQRLQALHECMSNPDVFNHPEGLMEILQDEICVAVENMAPAMAKIDEQVKNEQV